MATPVEEFTLESVRDYMISRDGRVTNHELVKHFKNFLTNPACKDEPPPPVPPRKRPGDNKENRRPSPEGEEGNRTNVMGGGGGSDVPDGAGAETPASAEDERKISVKEVSQKFNRMASEVQLIPSSRGSSKSNRSSRSDRDDDDSSSIHSQYGPEGQEWIVAAAKSDFNEILRLLKIHPSLARYKDISNGYTALHWAAKHGRHEVVKFLAQTHHVEINARSNGGYTPLHVAAMYNRTEVFDLLVHFGADLNMRDYSGKKARTYNTINSTVSHDTQKRIIQRRNSERAKQEMHSYRPIEWDSDDDLRNDDDTSSLLSWFTH